MLADLFLPIAQTWLEIYHAYAFINENLSQKMLESNFS